MAHRVEAIKMMLLFGVLLMAYVPVHGDSNSPSGELSANPDAAPNNEQVLLQKSQDGPLLTSSFEPGPGPQQPTVAFTAKLSIEDSYPKNSGVLKFTKVVVNEGSAYSPGTGIFICPSDGFYHFIVHMSVYGRGQSAIYKNGEKVVSMYHTNLPDKRSQVATISTVLQLSVNDEVWVNIVGPDTNDIFATEDNDTIFVGYRLA